jgi:multiple sugar transport system substrate-binding protein
MTRRRTSLLCALLCGTIGCASGEPGVVVEFWGMGREGEVARELVPEFERQHPGTRVRVQQIPWSAAHEKLLTAFVGGALPDVVQVGNTWLPELATLGAIEPLDARVAGSTAFARDDVFPGILDTNVIDGALWGVPWYVDTRLLFYRRDLLAAAGVAEAPRTWDAWTDAMARLRARGGADRFALLVPLREWQLPVILALQQGGALLRDGDCRGNFSSGPVREALAFYLGLFRRGFAPPSGDTMVANVYQDFAAGLFGFYVTGPWNLGEFARRLPPTLGDAWTTAPMPSPGAGYPGVSVAGGASLALRRGSAHADLAWALIEYLASPAAELRLHALAGDLPARRSAWDAGGLAHEPRTQAFWTQLGAVRATPKIPEWEQIADRVAARAEAAVRGGLDADATAAALDRDVDALLEKRRWLRERGH